MMEACAAFDPAAPLAGALTGFVDCQARALGAAGWAALGPGTGWGAALSGLMALAVAGLGYRLLLGAGGGLRAALGLALRLGLVLALAGQWPAWQALAYDLAVDGPGQLSGWLPGAQGPADLARRVDGVAQGVEALMQPAPAAPGAGGPAEAPWMRSARRAEGVFMISTLAALVAPRGVIGLLLALGPVFTGFALFGATQGLFAGWARVLLGAALAQVALGLVVQAELAVVEPELQALAAIVVAGGAAQGAVQQMGEVAWVFAGLALAVVLALAGATAALRWPHGLWRPAGALPQARAEPAVAVPQETPVPALLAAPAARARRTADAVLALERREAALALPMAQGAGPVPAVQQGRGGEGAAGPVTMGLGQAGRRGGQRVSAAARARDGIR
ncbi:MAG TPA: type IV secretion system protein [Novosphingobium sp.]|nr:type IV secretion system protein [Novosphingobium sp.]